MPEQTASPADRKVDLKVQFWLGEIAAARKREKDFRREGRRVMDIYEGKKKDSIPFNILFSNTETLLPALYNSQPRPVVQRRFKDEDPLGKVASQAGQRMLEFVVDTNIEDYDSFDGVMVDTVLDGLLPGRGATRVKYDAEILGQAPNRQVKWELVCFESLKWDRWTHGFARKWRKVPWVAFEHDVDLDEAKELFSAAVVAKMVFSEEGRLDDSEDDDRRRSEDEKTDETRKTCKVWEVWDRRTKKVLFVSPNYPDGFLKVDDDPLGLSGFFPMPEPLRFLRKSNNLMPTALYNLYENQAKELNRLSVRINRIAEAIKVRGAYDQTITELDDLLKQDDNVMVPAQNVAALQDGGLEKAIWLMPVEKLIVVLQQLYIARNNCKQVIYEITGIADILRGSTNAQETATAQEIKAQWGSLRLKRMQKEVARFARDALRIAEEIAAKKLSENTWAAVTGLPFSTQPQLQAANGQVAAARSMLAMQQPQLLMDPQAAQQALMQAVPEAFKTLQQPQWQAILQTLRSDTQRSYRIDIETNSTVDVEATEDQKLMGEVLTAVSQFIQGVAPLVINGSMPFEVAQSMLLAIVRRYRFGTEIEDYIKQMKPPTPPDQAKQKAEEQKQAFELKKAQDEHGLKMQESQAKVESARELAAIKMDIEREKLENEREKLRLDRERMVMEHQALIAELNAKVQAAHAMPKDRGKPGGKREGANASA